MHKIKLLYIKFTLLMLILSYGMWLYLKPQYYTQQLSYNISELDIKMLQKYINDGADVNFRDLTSMTPIMYAVCEARLDLTKILIKNGADVNAITANGYSALFFAAEKGYFPIAEELIKHGADVNIKVNVKGKLYTPYTIALKNNYAITAIKIKEYMDKK